MIRRRISRGWTVGLGIGAFALLILGYTILSEVQQARARSLGNENDPTIPTWVMIAEGVVKASTPDQRVRDSWLGEGEPPLRIWIVDDTLTTFGRLAGGLGVAVVISVLLGMLMGTYRWIEAILLPPLSFVARIPPTAMMAIFFVVAGLGFKMYVAMIAFGVLPTLTQSIHLAAGKGVPEELVNKALTLGASQFEVIWNVMLRQVLPSIIESVRLAIGPALVYLIAAELLVGDAGFGYRIRIQQKLLNMSVVYYYLVVLGVAGLLIDVALRQLLRKACPWYTLSR